MIDVIVNNIINEVDVNVATDETNVDFTINIESTDIDVIVNPEIAANKGDKGDKGDQGDQGIQGIQGIQGEQGIQGIKGDDGEGVPIGGEKNQILFKDSSTDFDTSFKYGWFDYLTGVKYTGQEATNSTGTIREVIFRGDTVFRLTSDAFTGLYPTVDAFYENFDGVDVSDKIVEKGD